MNRKKWVVLLMMIQSAICLSAQNYNWLQIRDIKSGVRFSMPENRQTFDTLSTRLYASALNQEEAVQVHIFENATFDLSLPVLNVAFAQEEGDTLRTIARLIALTSGCDITRIEEFYDSGNKGLEIEIQYQTTQTDVIFSSVIRYFIINGNFVAFTWTGESTSNPTQGVPPYQRSNKTTFFQSISTK